MVRFQGTTHFFLTDRELQAKLEDSFIIPDILLSFSLNQEITKKYILAIEYDAGTENPQYYGRDKIKKYVAAYQQKHPIFSHPELVIITFADNRKRTLQLLCHSMKHMNNSMQFLFAALDDVKQANNLFASIYVDPFRLDTNNGQPMHSLLD
jgi:hypothetical protein